MSTEVENRVVEMEFKNAAFEEGAAKTLATLDRLKQKLNFNGAKQGLQDIKTLDGNIKFDGMAKGIDTIVKKFGALNIAGITALTNIVNRAVNAGVQLIKSFTIDPIKDGFSQYQQQINATQTILANTAQNGGNLKNVTATLAVLNDYANKTIYNFSDMATNLGTFTSAGVKLGPAAEAIQGLSNVAAAAGAGTQQAAGAMYQLSQALGRGKLQAQDWNSVVAAGMASASFKTAILETAKAIGTLKIPKSETVAQWEKAGGSFQDAMQKGLITSDVLIQTLQVMTGNLTDAQLAAKGYTKEQIKSLQAMAKTAQAAAVNVKTVSALVDNLRQGVGSAYAQVFKTLLGDLPTATKQLTQLSGVLNTIFVDPVNHFNDFLKQFVKLGGVNHVVQGLINLFDALSSVLKPIKQGFRDIFPQHTAQDLLRFAKTFEFITKRMKISSETAKNLRRTFAGVFSIFDDVRIIVGSILGSLDLLIRGIHGSTGSLTGFTGNVGDLLVKFNEFLKKSNGFADFFDKIANLLLIPIHLIKDLSREIENLYGKFNGSTAAQKFADAFSKIADVFHPIGTGLGRISGLFAAIGHVLSAVGKKVGSVLSKIGTGIAGAFNSNTFDHILHLIDTGLLAAIALTIKKFFGKPLEVGGGFFDKIKETLGGVNDTLKLMQAQIKSNIILKIAEALGLLTASVFVLSTIDGDKLAKALAALAVGLVELGAALVLFNKYIGVVGAAKLPLISAALVELGGALLLMAAALKIMASIKPEDTGRALFTLGTTLFIVSKSMRTLSKDSGGMIAAATALGILGVALTEFAGALKLFSFFNWDQLAHGLASLASTLGVLIVAMRLMPTGMVAQAAALTILGVALSEIAGALKLFATVSWKELAHGAAAMGATLAIIAAAIYLIPPTAIAQAAGLVVVAGALTVLAGALKIMGSMKWESIGKAMVVLAGSLTILAAAMAVMTTGLPGAAALLVMSAALAVLAPVLAILGGMSWESILKSLVALAGAFAIIGVAGLVLGPLVPVILGLSAAILLLGAGLALVGVGALALATAFGIIASVGVAGVKTLADVINVFIQAIPTFVKALVDGLISGAVEVAKAAPVLVQSFNTVLTNILNMIILDAPKFAQAFLALLNAGITVVVGAAPRLADAGLKLLLALLVAIDNNIYRIVTVATDIITRFLKALGDNSGRVADQAFKTLIDFINGLSKAIDDNSEELGKAGAKLAEAIVKGLVKAIYGAHKELADAGIGLAKSVWNGATGWLHVHSPSRKFMELGTLVGQGFVIGLDNHSNQIESAGTRLGDKAYNGARDSLKRLNDLLSTNMDTSPTITPVIDLTDFRKKAADMANLINTQPIDASVSLEQARVISLQTGDSKSTESDTTGKVVQFKLEQNNYSPEALSTVDIYRHSNNLFAMAKKAVESA